MPRTRTIHFWSENGHIFCMEDGDMEPFDYDTHIYEKDAPEYITAEIEGLQSGGYEVIIGRPAYLTDNWQIEMEEKKYRKKGEG